jgi:hypothetical protein
MDLLYKIFLDPFVQMGSAPDLLVQTLWEGLVSGVLYALIALGFVLIFKASGWCSRRSLWSVCMRCCASGACHPAPSPHISRSP